MNRIPNGRHTAVGVRFNFVHPQLKPSAPHSADDTNIILCRGLSDDFAHFLKMHPGLSIEEAKRKFKEQQKLKAQQRKGPKMRR